MTTKIEGFTFRSEWVQRNGDSWELRSTCDEAPAWKQTAIIDRISEKRRENPATCRNLLSYALPRFRRLISAHA